jgi:aspartyl/asparaginyl-tRNA synthetase
MHRYRSHTCAALRKSDTGSNVRLSGWVHRVRDHGGVLFIDLRDHYGMTQVVADPDSPAFKIAEKVRGEWVIRIDGEVKERTADTVNPNLPTGEIEVFAQRDRSPVVGQGTAAAGLWRARLSGRRAPQVPLPRSAPRDAAQEHHHPHQGHRRHAQAA